MASGFHEIALPLAQQGGEGVAQSTDGPEVEFCGTSTVSLACVNKLDTSSSNSSKQAEENEADVQKGLASMSNNQSGRPALVTPGNLRRQWIALGPLYNLASLLCLHGVCMT